MSRCARVMNPHFHSAAFQPAPRTLPSPSVTAWEKGVNRPRGGGGSSFKPALAGGWYSIDLSPAKTYINKLASGSGLTQVRLRLKLPTNNNAIANFGDSGIDVESRGGTGDVNARIANNSAATTAAFPVAGLFLRSGNGTAGETSLLCANVSSNNMNGGSGAVADFLILIKRTAGGTPAEILSRQTVRAPSSPPF